jgi:transcriptional antiterminator
VLLLVLNARSVGILVRLVRSHSFVLAEELGREIGISRATVAKDVKTVNQWLQGHDLDTIRFRRSAGYYFEDAARISVKEKLGELNLDRQYKNTREERIAWIGVLLLIRENCIFNKQLTEKFSLSRSTIQRDFKLLAVTLNHFRLMLTFNKTHGYSISGDEQDKRKVLVYFLSKIHPHKETHWLNPDSHSNDEWRRELVASPHAFKINQILLDSEKYLNVCYPKDVIELLSIQLLLLLARYKQGKVVHLDPVEKVMVKPSPEFHASSFIGGKIMASFGIEIPDDELCYITVCLMGAKTHHPPANSSERHGGHQKCDQRYGRSVPKGSHCGVYRPGRPGTKFIFSYKISLLPDYPWNRI